MKEKVLIVEDELIVAKDLEHILQNSGFTVTGIARSVNKAIELVGIAKPDVVLLDIQLQGKQTGIDLAHYLNEQDIPFVYLSANSNIELLEAAKKTKPYGFMVKPFREDEVVICLDIARYRHTHSLEGQFKKEQILLAKITDQLIEGGTVQERLLNLAKALQPAIPFDYLEFNTTTGLHGGWLGFRRISFNEYQTIGKEEFKIMSGINPSQTDEADFSLLHQNTIVKYYSPQAFLQLSSVNIIEKAYGKMFGVTSCLKLPFLANNEYYGCISFYSRSGERYGNTELKIAERNIPSISRALSNIINAEQGTEPQEKHLAKSAAPAIKQDTVFKGIVGQSQQILSVLDFVEQVAAVDSTVLILGETGTGKEQIAHNIHNLSYRRNRPLVRVNCAALPSSLIESELFGHEKGAFTDASTARKGLFEQADGGTIFLDEIGDIPLQTQVKLLRVLQEKEVQRIGGEKIIKVDVRVVAATNKNLEKEVAEGRFRMDFYYRINVLPVFLPPLRERLEDIPLLAAHFLKLYSDKYKKGVKGISASAMHQLMQMTYKGNIRELENTIERCVVFAKGEEDIEKIFTSSPINYQSGDTSVIKGFDDVEREHIVSVLSQCHNKIYGPGGAAELLNVPPSTLTSKMKKLGISRKSI